MGKTLRRRRLEAKTDYRKRFNLLKSEMPRVVVRKSNKYLIAQVVASNDARDKTIVSASSKELLSQGWPKEKIGSLKSLQAGYLTGILLAKKTKGQYKKLILDIGLNRNISGSRIYSVVKGAVDSGLNILHDKNILPTEERMEVNKELASIVAKLKEKIK